MATPRADPTSSKPRGVDPSNPFGCSPLRDGEVSPHVYREKIMDRSPSIYYKKVLREVEQNIEAEKRRRFALIAKINLDIMDDQEHDRRVRDNTCHTIRRY